MDRLERKPDPEMVLRRFWKAMFSRYYSAIPGIVQSVDLANMKCAAQPSIRGYFPNPDNTYFVREPPVVEDCHLVLLGGGGMFVEVPLEDGDEVLMVIASRAIDNWYEKGGVQNPSEIGRMNNLSDAFAIPGIRSKPNVKSLTGGVFRIRTDANDAYIEFNPSSKSAKFLCPGGINLNGVTIDSSGNIANAASLSASGTIQSTAGEVDAKTAVKVNGTALTVP